MQMVVCIALARGAAEVVAQVPCISSKGSPRFEVEVVHVHESSLVAMVGGYDGCDKYLATKQKETWTRYVVKRTR